MKKHILDGIVLVVGVILILFGILAFFIPIIPGFLFVIFGVYLVSLKSAWAKSKLDKFIERHPSLRKFFKKNF